MKWASLFKFIGFSIVLTSHAFAGDSPDRFGISPGPIDEPALIVVHATRGFDAQSVAKSGIDAVIGLFRRRRDSKVFFLVGPDPTDRSIPDRQWYTKNKRPDYLLSSVSGEHNLVFNNSEITLAGGYLGLCHFRATFFAILGHPWRDGSVLNVHYPMRGIYVLRHLGPNHYGLGPDSTLLDEFKRRGRLKFVEYVLNELHLLGDADMVSELLGADSKYMIEIFVNGMRMTTINHGRNLVRLHFDSGS